MPKPSAEIFAENTLVGVSSHGVNRFPCFIELVKSKHIIPTAKPTQENSFNALEQWNGNFGAGPLNAKIMTARAMELSNEFGIGCVALKNSNHWMRPGYYAWEAANKGYVFICWTNTIPNCLLGEQKNQRQAITQLYLVSLVKREILY